MHYRVDATDGVYKAGAYGSIGLGGQAILIVPDYDLTIAVMAHVPPKRGRTAFYRTLLEHALSYEG